MAQDDKAPEAPGPAADSEPPKSTPLLEKLHAWGSSPFPPMALATLVASIHTRPIQPFPLLFAPALLFAGYVNVAGYAIDAAGMSAAWSGLYVLLSLRRLRSAYSLRKGVERAVRNSVSRSSWTPASLRTSSRRTNTPARNVVSMVAVGLGTVNCAAGTVTYTLMGDRDKEREEREERARWG